MWQRNFRPIRVVPDHATIFGACRQGNIQKVIELLQSREATIYDTDSCGSSLLHVSMSVDYQYIIPIYSRTRRS